MGGAGAAEDESVTLLSDAITPAIRVVNYACPGESTKTFVDGGCAGRRDVRGLHDAFEGPQLAAALAFLRAHRGQVSPITLTLWGNDLFDEFAPACKGDLVCIKSHARAGLARFASRLTSIVGRLRAAAPKAEIILTGAWNFDVEHLAKTDPLFRSIDATIERAAAAGKARVAKVYPVFSPVGNPAKAKADVHLLEGRPASHGCRLSCDGGGLPGCVRVHASPVSTQRGRSDGASTRCWSAVGCPPERCTGGLHRGHGRAWSRVICPR